MVGGNITVGSISGAGPGEARVQMKVVQSKTFLESMSAWSDCCSSMYVLVDGSLGSLVEMSVFSIASYPSVYYIYMKLYTSRAFPTCPYFSGYPGLYVITSQHTSRLVYHNISTYISTYILACMSCVHNHVDRIRVFFLHRT